MIERIQIISGDFSEAFEGMNYESLGRLFMATIAYANDKDPKVHLGENVPALTLYPVLKTHIERQEEYRAKMSNNGKKGGAPVGNTNATKTTKNNQKQPKTTKNNQKQAPSPSPCPSPIPSPIKRPSGEFQNVYLTDEEYEKVKSNGWLDLLEELSAYLDSKGDKYKNHYSALVSWNARRKKESGTIVKPKQFQQLTKTKYDMTALERKLIKN